MKDELKIEKLKKKLRTKNYDIISLRSCIHNMNERLIHLLDENKQLKEQINESKEVQQIIQKLDNTNGCVRRNFQCDHMFQHIKTSLTFYKSFYIEKCEIPTHQDTIRPNNSLEYKSSLQDSKINKSISFSIPNEMIDQYIDDDDYDYEDSDDEGASSGNPSLYGPLPESPENTTH